MPVGLKHWLLYMSTVFKLASRMFCRNLLRNGSFVLAVILIVFALSFGMTMITYMYYVQTYAVMGLYSSGRKSDDSKTLPNRFGKNVIDTNVIWRDFNRAYTFKELHDNNMYSFYNVCVETRTPPLRQNSSWGTFIETQKIVVHNVGWSPSSDQRDVTVVRHNISVAGSPSRTPWNHWELYFTNASIPSTHTFLPTTAFFVSESSPQNLYHAWNDLFLQLFSVVRDANRLHPGMQNQIVYRNPRSFNNLSDAACKFCRRSPYDFLQQTLYTTNEYFLFYELPTNTCYSSAVFGTRYSGRRVGLRESVDHVLKKLQLAYRTRHPRNRNVVIVERQNRRIINIHALAKEAERIGFKNIRVLDLERMSALEQMSTMVGTDILIGVQGAALQWAIFMRPGSTLVEISWPKKYWGSCYSFVQRYKINFLKYETDDAFVNWEPYEKRWGKVNGPEERLLMLDSPPRTRDDNIWKYADVLINVTDFRKILERLR